MKLDPSLGTLFAACLALGTALSPAFAAEDLGSFPGYTLKVKLIGGTQYEKLYTRIPEWEKATGAKVEIENVDRRLEQAAATLGAGPLRVFLTITLPLAWPGIVAGAVLAFAKALGEFGATITFVSSIPGETETMSTAIYGLMQVPGGEAGIWRLAAVAVALSLGALLASEWLVRRQRGGADA